MTGYKSKRAAAQDKLAQPAQNHVEDNLTMVAQPAQERNFCPRCGKRTPDLETIHTCTPPQDKNK